MVVLGQCWCYRFEEAAGFLSSGAIMTELNIKLSPVMVWIKSARSTAQWVFFSSPAQKENVGLHLVVFIAILKTIHHQQQQQLH